MLNNLFKERLFKLQICFVDVFTKVMTVNQKHQLVMIQLLRVKFLTNSGRKAF